MVTSLRKKTGIGEVIAFFIPVLIILLGTVLAIFTEDYIYLKMCTIAGYFFIPLFVWRLCVFVYYNALLQAKEDEEDHIKDYEK